MDVTGQMQMPGEDWQNEGYNGQFKGMGVDGYDNVKEKVRQLVDRQYGHWHSIPEGTDDPTSKTPTYHERNGNDARNENASPRSAEAHRQKIT